MMQMWWPIFLIVFSNVIYNICAKTTPAKINPLAGLTITYAVSAIFSAILYKLLTHGDLFQEYKNANLSLVAFGFALVGLEAGSIYMYRAGWNISVGQVIHGGLLAVCLIVVGFFVYHEQITISKLLGILTIFLGLYLINR